jgi:hypothetical protein
MPDETTSARARAATENRHRVHDVSAWRYALLWPLGMLLRLWARTLRISFPPGEEAWFADTSRPAVLLIWHNRLFVVAELYRRWRSSRRLAVLVSASRDGALLTAYFRMAGIEARRGSSSRRSLSAARELVGALREGLDVGITPDGPLGPCYDFKPGALMVARTGNAPVVLISGAFDSAWRLRSWDRFYIPLPFSRVRMRCRRIASARDEGPRTYADAARYYQQAMLALTPDDPDVAAPEPQGDVS